MVCSFQDELLRIIERKIFMKSTVRLIVLLFIVSFLLPVCSFAENQYDSHSVNSKTVKSRNIAASEAYLFDVARYLSTKWESKKNEFRQIRPVLKAYFIIKIMPDGKIEEVILSRGSGSKEFDDAVNDFILASGRLKPFPKEITWTELVGEYKFWSD